MNINSTNNDNLKDPAEELPFELFSHSLSFLPPQSIAISSALSQKWRSTINSSPALHNEIDLLSWEQEESIPILFHFNRVSALSLDRLVKVSLNLTSFWEDTIKQEPQGLSTLESLNSNISTFDIFLLTLEKSKQNLKEISVFIRYHQGLDLRRGSDPLPFITYLIKQLQSFSALQSVKVQAPTVLHLKASQKPPGRKEFSLNDSSGTFSGDLNHAAGLMKEVKRLVKGGFNEFKIATLYKVGLRESVEIMQALASSSTTLQHLDIRSLRTEDDRLQLWPFALKCSNLISLEVWLFQDLLQTVQAGSPLVEVPEGVGEAFHLKNLHLEIFGCNTGWESILKWIGTGLEELTLKADRPNLELTGLPFDGMNVHVILNSKDTIKLLVLDGIQSQQDPNLQNQVSLSFPNLEALSITRVDDATWKIFSKLKSPKLQSLKMEIIKVFGSVGPNENSLECLLNILHNHSETLVKMHLEMGLLKWEDVQKSFTFRSLTSFSIVPHIGMNQDDSAGIFSSFHYPVLRELRMARRLRDDETEKFKSLMKKNAPQLTI